MKNILSLSIRKIVARLAMRDGNRYKINSYIAMTCAALICSAGNVPATQTQAGNTYAQEHATTHPSEKIAGSIAPAVRTQLLQQNVDEIAFVKRFTYNSNHYYTEYLNTKWMPGGNIYVLSVKNGEIRELAPELTGGVFGAFDVSFDARKIVFAYKAEQHVGYRIYEVGTDGSQLRQLTFSPEDEVDVVNKYKIAGYHHGTEDLDPCYLPDGSIAFISTRCRFGILCDAPDIFTTTVLYRMDGDGGHLQKLSNSSVSESTPAVLPDGRIMYTRWEYVDKGAVAVKCLWAMNPDGTNSVEIYGNDIAFPTTMIMGRPIPNAAQEYVFTGTPHCPQNCVGTVVRINTSKNIRTTEPMTYITPNTDIQKEEGFMFRDTIEGSKWVEDREGRGALYRETYPLTRSEYLVSHKPAGAVWYNPKSYQLYLLHEGGKADLIYADTTISCFHPMPVRVRPTPPVIPSKTNNELAAQNLAECIVTDVYRGMTGVEAGEIKYLRVLEQVPRPWAARRFYPHYTQDEYDQQHVVITKDSHLGLKIQHGIVTVEADGSARFLVPAEKNIFLQALDANMMALQTERTYINYMRGETRSCIGCHESSSQAPMLSGRMPVAMKRRAELPYPQTGEATAQKTLSYARDVQPVWDKHCIACHNAEVQHGNLSLSGQHTRLFNESYENLVPERRKTQYDRGLLGQVIGENHPKTGNIHYLPARSLGSHTSVLVAMLLPSKITLNDPQQQQRADKLSKTHSDVKLSDVEILQITNWIDTNCQYYGTYYGRRDTVFASHPDYRKEYDVQTAVNPQAPTTYE